MFSKVSSLFKVMCIVFEMLVVFRAILRAIFAILKNYKARFLKNGSNFFLKAFSRDSANVPYEMT